MAKVKLEKKQGHVIYKTKAGLRVPGASTVAQIGEKSEGLLYWAWDLGMQGLDFRKVRDEAADAGTVAHFWIMCHLKGDEPDLSEFSPEVINLAETCVLKFLEMWGSEELTYVASEYPLVSDQHGFGGTIDLKARDKQGRIAIIDYKTSKQIYPSTHIVQLAAYEALENENSLDKVQRRAIFRIGKKIKGDLELRWLPDLDTYFKVFLDKLNLYRSLKTLS